MAGGALVDAGSLKRAHLYEYKITGYFIFSCIVGALGGSLFGYDLGVSGAVLNAAAKNIAMLIIGRVLLGVGIGFGNQRRNLRQILRNHMLEVQRGMNPLESHDERNADEWVYRGEGAANLVLAYTGSSPMFIGKVMRIRKAPRNGVEVMSMRSPSALTAHERLLWKDVHELISSSDNEIAGQLFVHHVMKPLLGAKYVDAGMLIRVSKKFLELVEKNVIFQRPAWRVDDAQVDMHRDYISLLSEYNPLDLFSGSMERIHKAIKDLFTTPQNNFRVFKNGSLIFGGLGGGAEDTNCCIAKTFEDELKSVIQADDGHYTENLLTLVAEAVRQSGVLDRLLEVQKLDNVDIEGAIHAYYDITHQHCPICRELGEEELKRYSSLHSTSLDESVRIVKDYLIAATAKDCSFMICFRSRKEGYSESECNSIYLESTKQAFDFKGQNGKR
ncbi:hypothetical protein Fmac_003825 [Flemingia macrophylla]|uniref:Inositol-pentakisphosphate 2-kinase n=1 Tax=Flemingia macrophylla TaxID=520843 RepID=A0ABD1N358_9FABA